MEETDGLGGYVEGEEELNDGQGDKTMDSEAYYLDYEEPETNPGRANSSESGKASQ